MKILTIILMVSFSYILFDQNLARRRLGSLSLIIEGYGIHDEKEKQKRKKRKYKNRKYKKRKKFQEKLYKFKETKSRDHRYLNHQTLRRMYRND